MNPSFIDTNILVYAYDADAGFRYLKSKELLREYWNSELGCISTQVLQEFYVIVTRKLPRTLSKPIAREIIQTYRAWGAPSLSMHVLFSFKKSIA